MQADVDEDLLVIADLTCWDILLRYYGGDAPEQGLRYVYHSESAHGHPRTHSPYVQPSLHTVVLRHCQSHTLSFSHAVLAHSRPYIQSSLHTVKPGVKEEQKREGQVTSTEAGRQLGAIGKDKNFCECTLVIVHDEAGVKGNQKEVRQEGRGRRSRKCIRVMPQLWHVPSMYLACATACGPEMPSYGMCPVDGTRHGGWVEHRWLAFSK